MKRRKYTSSRLRHRLTLQQEDTTEDGAGGYARSWQDIADVWAEIIPLSGKELLFAGQLQAEVTHRILIRYRDAVHAGQRLVFDGRVFNIHAVMNIRENDDLLELTVAEGTGG